MTLTGAELLPSETALGLDPGDVVALVGAGGKTTLLHALSEAALGSVLATSTVHFSWWIPEVLISFEEVSADLEAASSRLRSDGRLAVFREELEKTRYRGIETQEINSLNRELRPDLVVIEADGARCRLIKAPAPYEPVIPEFARVVVSIVGVGVVGSPLTPEFVHRPQYLSRVLDKPQGSTLTCEDVAKVLMHPEGGRARLPEGARAIPFLSWISLRERIASDSQAKDEVLEDTESILESLRRLDCREAVWGDPRYGGLWRWAEG